MNLIKKAFVLITLFFLFTSIVWADGFIDELKKCGYPEKPDVPSDNVLSEDEIIVIQKEVKAYVNRGEQYLDCIAAVEKNRGEEISIENKSLILLLHNNIVDEMENIAELFNSALRVYKTNN